MHGGIGQCSQACLWHCQRRMQHVCAVLLSPELCYIVDPTPAAYNVWRVLSENASVSVGVSSGKSVVMHLKYCVHLHH